MSHVFVQLNFALVGCSQRIAFCQSGDAALDCVLLLPPEIKIARRSTERSYPVQTVLCAV